MYKINSCDCNDEGCKKCTCEDCGDLLVVGEETKCNICISEEEERN